MSKTTQLDRTLMEIGYAGAFYGMHSLALDIFDFYQAPNHSFETQTAAVLGKALVLIGQKRNDEAAKEIETFIQHAEQTGETTPAEVMVFLILAYRKAKKHGDRVETLLGELSQIPKEVNHAVHSATQQLAS